MPKRKEYKQSATGDCVNKRFIVTFDDRHAGYENCYTVIIETSHKIAVERMTRAIGPRFADIYEDPSGIWEKVEVDGRKFVEIVDLLKKPPRLESDTEIPFSFRQIGTYFRANYSVDVQWEYLQHTLDRWAEDFDVRLSPDYQRCHVWTTEQQIKYIEYVLQEGPYGKDLQWNSPGWQTSLEFSDHIELVDGKQRMQAVTLFLNNKLPVFGGRLRKNILGYMPSCASFKFHVNSLMTRAEVLTWYLQINAGGVAHTKEEIEKVQQMLMIENKKNAIEAVKRKNK